MAGGVMRGLAAMAGLAVSLFTAVPAPAAEPVRLVYVEFFPYSFTEDGEPAGVLIDAFETAAERLGFAYTVESAPAKRLFQGIARGEYDVFLGVRSAQAFAGTTLVSDSVIARIELRAWALGEAPPIRAREDLAGRSLITMAGYTYGGWRAYIDDPANGVTAIEATSPSQALQLLERGRAPVLLQYRLPMEQALAGRSLPELRSTLISSTDLHIVVSNRMPDGAAFLRRLETAFGELGLGAGQPRGRVAGAPDS